MPSRTFADGALASLAGTAVPRVRRRPQPGLAGAGGLHAGRWLSRPGQGGRSGQGADALTEPGVYRFEFGDPRSGGVELGFEHVPSSAVPHPTARPRAAVTGSANHAAASASTADQAAQSQSLAVPPTPDDAHAPITHAPIPAVTP